MASIHQSDNVYLKGLPAQTSQYVVEELLSQYGQVVSTKLLPPKGGNRDMVAMVQMGSVEEASAVISALNGLTLTAKFSTKGSPAASQPDAGAFTPRDGAFAPHAEPTLPTRPAFTPHAEPSTLPTRPAFTPRDGAFAPHPEIWDTWDTGGAGGSGMNLGFDQGGSSMNIGFDQEGQDANLYIKGLPLETTYDGLMDMFIPFGTVVSAKLLPPKAGTAHQDVIAMVRMGSVDEAQYAIENLNHAPIAAPGDLPLRAKYHGDGHTPADNIFIKGLPMDTHEAFLREACSAFGHVMSIKLLPKPGLSDLAALVRFGSVDEAATAIMGLEGQVLPNKNQKSLIVRFANERKAAAAPPRSIPATFAAPPRSIPATFAAPPYSRPVPTRPTAPIGIPASMQAPAPAYRMQQSAPAGPIGGGLAIKAKYHGDGHTPTDNIFLKGLPLGTSEDALRQVCSRFGSVMSIKLLPPRGDKKDLAALVRFASVDMAASAILALDGQMFPSRGGGGGGGGVPPSSKYGPVAGKLNFAGMIPGAPY